MSELVRSSKRSVPSFNMHRLGGFVWTNRCEGIEDVPSIPSKQEEERKAGAAEWSGSSWHLPSGLPGHGRSTCQEPLILNTELDLTDKRSRCCRPMASLAGERRVTSFLRRPRQQRLQTRKRVMQNSSGSFETAPMRNYCRPPAFEAKGLKRCRFCWHFDISYK